MRSAYFVETPLGCFGIGWGETGLCRLALPEMGWCSCKVTASRIY